MFLKVLENITEIPANRDMLPHYRSSTSKWIFFISNIQDELWDSFSEILTLDYTRELHSQVIQNQSVQPNTSAPQATEEVLTLKGFSYSYFIFPALCFSY